jgi:hypothetical protein
MEKLKGSSMFGNAPVGACLATTVWRVVRPTRRAFAVSSAADPNLNLLMHLAVAAHRTHVSLS